MSYDSLLGYIRDRPGLLKLEIWSGIKMDLDAGEPVHMSLPRSLEEFEVQFKSLVAMGTIAETKGRWVALDVPRPPAGKQAKMF